MINNEKIPELIQALAEFNHYYTVDLEGDIKVEHKPGDVRCWTANDFFKEGFLAALRLLRDAPSE